MDQIGVDNNSYFWKGPFAHWTIFPSGPLFSLALFHSTFFPTGPKLQDQNSVELISTDLFTWSHLDRAITLAFAAALLTKTVCQDIQSLYFCQ